MPGYPWLAQNKLDAPTVESHMRALRTIGDPYTDDDLKSVKAAVDNKTELDALVAYLQSLGKFAPKE
jgi:cytochrome c oxidase cbb3-type subunit 2